MLLYADFAFLIPSLNQNRQVSKIHVVVPSISYSTAIKILHYLYMCNIDILMLHTHMYMYVCAYAHTYTQNTKNLLNILYICIKFL